jgi:hypothetical protein
MKCAMCNRPLFTAAFVAGDYAFGPKCAKKLKGANPSRRRKAKRQVDHELDNLTLPLFGDLRAV